METAPIDKASQLRSKLAANEGQAATLRSACAELEARLRVLLGEDPTVAAAAAREPEPAADAKTAAEHGGDGKDRAKHDQHVGEGIQEPDEQSDRERSRKEMVELARSIQKAHIGRLHAYNEVRDLGNALLAKIAAATGETQRAVMARYGVEADD